MVALLLLAACQGDAAGPEAGVQLALVSPPAEETRGNVRSIQAIVTNTSTKPVAIETNCAFFLEIFHQRRFTTANPRVCLAISQPVVVPPGESTRLIAGWYVGTMENASGERTNLPLGRHIMRGRLHIGDATVYTAQHAVDIRPAS
jgi:hypothetical protein